MKSKIFTLIAIFALMSFGTAKAQLFWAEDFNYTVGALIPGALTSSDNSTINNALNLTDWLTQSNSVSGVDCFDVLSGSLTYNGFPSSGIGNSLKYNNTAGQGIYKLFPKLIKNDSTIYISFMINIPGDVAVTGGDYFFAVKMEPAATSTNWAGRLFAAVEPTFPNEEITFGIAKASGASVTQATKYFAANTTHLIVYKYKVGILNGLNATEETGKYDDQMTIYVDPVLTGGEPATPTIFLNDPAQKDAYRYTSTGTAFGGARGLYLRSSATGNAPAYTIDGIRSGLTWSDVISAPSGLKSTTADNFIYSLDKNKQLNINTTTAYYNNFSVVSLSGQQILKGLITGQNTKINASCLNSGVYILNLNGNQQASAKFIVR